MMFFLFILFHNNIFAFQALVSGHLVNLER